MAHPAPDLTALLASGLFEPWTHPESGIRSWLYSDPAVPFTQNLYFVNDGFAPNHPLAWVYVAYPPSGRCLGVLNLENVRLEVFPDTHFLDASPMVHPDNGEAWWIAGNQLWRRSHRPEDRPVRVNGIPPEISRNRNPKRIATHLTLRSDGRTVNIDAEYGNEWIVGELPVDGGELNIWRRESICYNHGQFSPVDPDLQLVNQDGWTDPATGTPHDYTHRMWLFHRNGTKEPLFANPTPKHGHEWWDPDGDHIWYVHYGVGVERVNLKTRKIECVLPGAYSHAYSSLNGKWLVVDQCVHSHAPRCEVEFINLETGKRVHMANQDWILDADLLRYHVHPHPRFVLKDRYVCYTSIVRGRVELALTPVEDLLAGTT